MILRLGFIPVMKNPGTLDKFYLAQLRHLYEQMLNGKVTDTKQAAVGLLGPVIEHLELYFQNKKAHPLE